MSQRDDEKSDETVPFEELVAALLKVDPEGITGQRTKKKPEPDEG